MLNPKYSFQSVNKIFFSIWPSDLASNPTWPKFELVQDLMEMNFLTNCHGDWMLNAVGSVFIRVNVDDAGQMMEWGQTKCYPNTSTCTACIGELKRAQVNTKSSMTTDKHGAKVLITRGPRRPLIAHLNVNKIFHKFDLVT